MGVCVIVVDVADVAARILQQLQRGSDFAVTAREKSTDATSVEGGFLGQVGPAAGVTGRLAGLAAGRVLPRRAVAIRFRHPASPDGVRSANLDQASGARPAVLAAGGGIRFGPTLTGSRNRCRPSRRLPSQAAGTKSRADACSQGQLYASRSSGSFSPLSSRIWDEMCTAIEPSSLKIQTERAHRTLPACRRTISASTILLLGMPCRWLPLSSNASDRARNSAEVIIVAVAIRSFQRAHSCPAKIGLAQAYAA